MYRKTIMRKIVIHKIALAFYRVPLADPDLHTSPTYRGRFRRSRVFLLAAVCAAGQPTEPHAGVPRVSAAADTPARRLAACIVTPVTDR